MILKSRKCSAAKLPGNNATMETQERKLQSEYMRNALDEYDAVQQDSIADSGTFMNSAFFSPESVLPTYFLMQDTDSQDTDQTEIKPVVPKAMSPKTVVVDEPPHSSGWLGLIASIAVGMIIAILLFPMIEYTKRSTKSYVTDNWVSEINRRVDQYEQIHGNQVIDPQIEELLPLNLTLSDWQELRPESMVGSLYIPAGSMNVPVAETQISFSEYRELAEKTYAGQIPSGEPGELPEYAEWHELFMPDTYVQIWMQEGKNMVRSAFGQGIFIQDGRVFFRVLPGTEPKR